MRSIIVFGGNKSFLHLSALGIASSMLSLAPSTSIVRGYNQTFFFNFAITDHDQIIDVDVVNGESANFLVTTVFSSSEVTTTFIATDSISLIPTVSKAQLQQRIAPNATVELSGQGTVLVPRKGCTQYQYVCVVLQPGPGSSIKIPEGSVDHISCIQTSEYINCEGTKGT